MAGTASSSAANEPQSSLGFGFVMVNEETGAIPGVVWLTSRARVGLCEKVEWTVVGPCAVGSLDLIWSEY